MSKEKDTQPQLETVDAELGSTAVLPKQNALQRLLHRQNDPNELGKHMLEQSLQYDQAQLEMDAVKVRRKLDFLVLPMVICDLPRLLDIMTLTISQMMTTYMLSFLDKQT